jgi:hypothetical protein
LLQDFINLLKKTWRMKKILLLVVFILAHYFAEAKDQFYIKVLNGISQGHSGGIDYYSIPNGDSLKLTAMFQSFSPMMTITGLSVDWYIDNTYQFTQGGTVSFNQPSVLIYCEILYDPYANIWITSDNKIMFTYVTGINDLTSAPLTYPFSQSAINTTNLQYKIVSAMGQVIEEGKFTGEIILRNKSSHNTLQPGIYFVIYSDALDNRQVLTDKVFLADSQ